MTHVRRVWGIGSPRTLRPHWMLHELGLDYETRAILPRSAEMDDPELRGFTQRRKVPFFEDGEVKIGESGAITFYLADRYRDRAQLAPDPGTAERAAFEELAFFILMELDATALYVLRRHEGLPDVYGNAPDACAAARGYFQRMVGEIERRLADGRPHLLGDAFSAVDVLLASCLAWAQFVQIPLAEPLAAYQTRIASRPAFGRAMQVNFPPEAFAALAARR
ncbi:MAG: glutathione S-transferase family protein [Deltaproteobacteria bacterium]|nr:MAG: glutathione S-transferase family protein [Deltaproteobacteria bacterium]